MGAVEPNENDIATKVGWLKESKELRNSMSKLAEHHIKGNGAKNICSLIESIKLDTYENRGVS